MSQHPSDKKLADVLALAPDVSGRGKRSELFLWMRRNFDAIDRGLKSGDVNWAKLYAGIVAEGLKDWQGKTPTLICAQATLHKVRAQKGIARKRVSQGPRQPAQDAPPTERRKLVIRPAQPRKTEAGQSGDALDRPRMPEPME